MSLKSSNCSCLKACFRGYTFCFTTFLARPSTKHSETMKKPQKTFKWPWKIKVSFVFRKVIEFLVGVKENRWNQTAAIGGAWSESLDGRDPETDPFVLVRTAVRTVRGLTGVDLSGCPRWHRVVDIHYVRVEEDATKVSRDNVTKWLVTRWSIILYQTEKKKHYYLFFMRT